MPCSEMHTDAFVQVTCLSLLIMVTQNYSSRVEFFKILCCLRRKKIHNFLLQEIRDIAQYLGIEPTVIAGEDLKKGGFGGMLSTFQRISNTFPVKYCNWQNSIIAKLLKFD